MSINNYKIIIIEDSGLVKKNPYDVRGETIYIHGDIYRNLGSLVKSSQIEEHEYPNNIFQDFMKDMNSLYDLTQEYQPSEQDKIKLRIIDEYLGSLGVDIEYPKDRYKFNLKSSITANGSYVSPF